DRCAHPDRRIRVRARRGTGGLRYRPNANCGCARIRTVVRHASLFRLSPHTRRYARQSRPKESAVHRRDDGGLGLLPRRFADVGAHPEFQGVIGDGLAIYLLLATTTGPSRFWLSILETSPPFSRTVRSSATNCLGRHTKTSCSAGTAIAINTLRSRASIAD